MWSPTLKPTRLNNKKMATKPYPQIEEATKVVEEPVVAYQSGIVNTIPGHTLTTYEKDKIVEEWLHPQTFEEINTICDEAEADDEADRLLSCDFVHAEMERSNPWLCK